MWRFRYYFSSLQTGLWRLIVRRVLPLVAREFSSGFVEWSMFSFLVAIVLTIAAPFVHPHWVEIHFIFAPNNTLSNVAASRIACLAARSCQYRSPVSPLTAGGFRDSRAGTLQAINSSQPISLTVRHSGRGHRDQLPGNYGVADEWNRRRNSSMISCARVHARARRDRSGVRSLCTIAIVASRAVGILS
jgi:hypothetical protein